MQGPEHLPAYKPGGRLETFDIEELVAEGKAGYECLLCVPIASQSKCCDGIPHDFAAGNLHGCGHWEREQL